MATKKPELCIRFYRPVGKKDWYWRFTKKRTTISDGGQGYSRRTDCVKGAAINLGITPEHLMSLVERVNDGEIVHVLRNMHHTVDQSEQEEIAIEVTIEGEKATTPTTAKKGR